MAQGGTRTRLIAVLAVWLGVVSSIVANIATAVLPKFVADRQKWFWLVVVLLGLLATYLALRRDPGDGWSELEKETTQPRPGDREQALAAVREFADRLHQRLGSHPDLTLTLSPTPGRLPERARAAFERHGATMSVHKPAQAYSLFRSMLLLGEAGAGKTTMLLDLAEDLLKQAEAPNEEPVPFIVSLSGWGRPRPSWRRLDRWLRWRSRRLIRQIRRRPAPERPEEDEDLVRFVVGRLNSDYRVRRGVARAWLRQGALVLLFDGLDECAEEARDRFVGEFDRLAEVGSLQVAMSCRTPDFDRLARVPKLQSAWTVQPLTRAQVEQALDPGLRGALHEDDDLWQLLSAPIWLRVLRQLNHWPDRVRDPSVSVTDRRRDLLDAFLDEIIHSRTRAGATAERMISWLAQMAQLTRSASDPDSVDLRAPTRGAQIPSSALFAVVVRAVPVLLVLPFALGFVLPIAWVYGLASAGQAISQSGALWGIPILAFLASGLAAGYDRSSGRERRTRTRLACAAVLSGLLLGLLGLGLVLGLHALAVTSMNTVRWVLVAGFALAASIVLLRSTATPGRILAAGLAALGVASLFVPVIGPDRFTGGAAGAIQGVLLMFPLLAILASRNFTMTGFRLTPAMLIVMPATVGLGLAVCLAPLAGMWFGRRHGVLGRPVTDAIFDGWLLAAVCLLGLAFVFRGRWSTLAGRLFLAAQGRLPWRLEPLLSGAASHGLFILSEGGYRFAHPLLEEHLAEFDVLDLRPLAEPDPGWQRQALARAGQVLTARRALSEPPVRFPLPLSDESDIPARADKPASPDAGSRPAVIDGPAGSGRSTLLLDLAAELAAQPDGPVPLVLPTSVWNTAAIRADGRESEQADEYPERTFTRLLLRAADREYGLPPPTVRQLLFHGELILLLDDDRLSRLEMLRFMHLVASFHEAYPKVGLVLTADLATLPTVIREENWGPVLLNDASTTRIVPFEPDVFSHAPYADHARPLREFGFPGERNQALVTRVGQLRGLLEAAAAAPPGRASLDGCYLAKALASPPEEHRLREVMQKIAWLRGPDKVPKQPSWFGWRSLWRTIRTPPPLARAEVRCATPAARGLILALGAAYALAPRFGTPTALLGSLILILLDIAWSGRPGRKALGGAISVRQRGAALILGAAIGLALGLAALGLHGQVVQFIEGWASWERSLVLPVSAGLAIVMLCLPDGHSPALPVLGIAGLITAATLYFAGPRPPEVFFQGFGIGVATGGALSFVLALKSLFTPGRGGLPQPRGALIVRVAVTLTWYGMLCAVAALGHPLGLQLWPVAGVVLGYCCSALPLTVLTIFPAYLSYGPAFWFLSVSSGFLPWRLTPVVRTAQARGWLLPDRAFRDPLVQRFLSDEAERVWTPPDLGIEELFQYQPLPRD